MLRGTAFWRLNQAGLVCLYVVAVGLYASGQTGHSVVLLCLAILGLHVLELPLAFRAVRGRAPITPALIVGTLLFGLFWWIPAAREARGAAPGGAR